MARKKTTHESTSSAMGFENVWFSRKGPKPSADGVKGKVISGKGTRECRYARQPDGAAAKRGFFWRSGRLAGARVGVAVNAGRHGSVDGECGWVCKARAGNTCGAVVAPGASGALGTSRTGRTGRTSVGGACVRVDFGARSGGGHSGAGADGDNLLQRQVVAFG